MTHATLQTSAGGGPVLRVRALLQNPHGKILAVKHHGSDFFSLPGGKVDAKESAKEALLCELQEELALSPVGLRLRYILEIPHINSLEMYFVGSIAEDNIEGLTEAAQAAELAEVTFLSSLKENFKPLMLAEIPLKDIFAEDVTYLGVAHQ